VAADPRGIAAPAALPEVIADVDAVNVRRAQVVLAFTVRPGAGDAPSSGRSLSLTDAAVTTSMSSTPVRLPWESLTVATASKASVRSRSAKNCSPVSIGACATAGAVDGKRHEAVGVAVRQRLEEDTRTTVNIAVTAPIPSASTVTAAAA